MTALISHLDPAQCPSADTRSNVRRAGVPPLGSSEEGCWNRKDLACLVWHAFLHRLPCGLRLKLPFVGLLAEWEEQMRKWGKKTSKDLIAGNFPRSSSLVSQLYMDLISGLELETYPKTPTVDNCMVFTTNNCLNFCECFNTNMLLGMGTPHLQLYRKRSLIQL